MCAQALAHQSDSEESIIDERTIYVEILLWNLEKGKKSPIPRAERNMVIQDIADNNIKHVLVLASEVFSNKIHTYLAQAKKKKRDAAIIYRGDPEEMGLKIKMLDLGYLQGMLDRYKQSEEFALGRFDVVMVNGVLIVAAYHGPNTVKGKRDEKKKSIFEDVITVLEKVRKDKRCKGVIIGGDFNLGCDVATSSLDDLKVDGNEIKGKVFTATDPDRAKPLDYLVCWPKNNFRLKDKPSLITVEDVEAEVKGETVSGAPFDHPLIFYRLQFNPSGEGGESAQLEGPMKELDITN